MVIYLFIYFFEDIFISKQSTERFYSFKRFRLNTESSSSELRTFSDLIQKKKRERKKKTNSSKMSIFVVVVPNYSANSSHRVKEIGSKSMAKAIVTA